MILHNIPGAPSSRKVLAVISHLGLDVEVRNWDAVKGELRTAEYLAINPNAKVPALVDGDFILWESTAIMHYLADSSPDTTLFPRDPRARADITRWQSWEGIHFNAAFGTLVFETLIKPRNNLGTPDRMLVEPARDQLSRFAPVLDRHLQGREFVAQERLTLADYSVVAMEPYMDLIPFDFGPYSHIRSYFERMRQSEHWARTAAAKPSTSQSIAA